MISLSLTQTAEYALRAMSGLALAPKGGFVRASELARKTGVPLPYLWKIMRNLVDAGLARSAKGHGGGFRLARAADQITYLDVLEVNGYKADAETCVFGWGLCRADRPCPMHHTWSDLNGRFVAWARATTLASLRGGPPAVPSGSASEPG